MIMDLRTLLRDRQKKAGALGTATAEVCLDTSLIDDLVTLHEERTKITDATKKGDGTRLVSAPEPDTTDADARIDTKDEEIAAATVRMIFKSLSSTKYQELVNNHPDVDTDDKPAARAAFLDQLIRECLTEVHLGGEKQDEYDIDDIQGSLTFGEWEPIRAVVFALNRRPPVVPFSLKPSRKTR